MSGRVTGFCLFQSLSAEFGKMGARVFLLGSSDSTLDLLRTKIVEDFPGTEVVGVYSPPFKPEFSEKDMFEMIKAVNRSAPDVLWVGMTSPKQGIFISKCLPKLDVRFTAGIGAVFDFYTGVTTRASELLIRHNLEWLDRLVKSPRKMWRRVFISGPIFLFDLIRHRFFLCKLPRN